MSVQAIDRIQPLWTDLQTEGMRLDAGAGAAVPGVPSRLCFLIFSVRDRPRTGDGRGQK